MVQYLSEDLHRRVIEAVGAGAACRQAAARSEVPESDAIRCFQEWHASGHAAPLPRDDDRRFGLLEREAANLLAKLEETHTHLRRRRLYGAV